MPTGYTHAVQEGKITTLREFALTCARAFGATIMMRDDPADKPIPEAFEPETKYYDEGIAEARATLAEVAALRDDQCEDRAAHEFDEALKRHVERGAERTRQKARYQEMLGKVERWEVPDDIRSLRDFMLEQLRSSIDFDCSESYRPEPPIRKTAQQWREATLAEASRALARYEQSRQEEIDRTAGRNAWIKSLRDSLPPAEPKGFA